ncbi:hypothetical protein BGX31_006927 [Mortierella sp. GBA43]|nr:hypothetical protein BGX31_006927 [Mortierella sp. GBA43]
MDYTSSSRGDNTFANSKPEAHAPGTGSPSTTTSLAAAAPESSTLAVKLSEDPEGHSLSGNQDVGDDKQSILEDSRTFLKEGEDESRSRSPAGIRRSRSGRLLRSTVQYDERSSRSTSPDDLAEQEPHAHKTRSAFHNKTDSDRPFDPSEQDSSTVPESGAEDNQRRMQEDGGSPSRQREEGQDSGQYGDDNRDELASDDEQDEDGYTEVGDDGNNEGSGSAETSSTKNDDGSEALVVSMYGSPSLVKVRSMFIDKLYKMVEDHSIQHLISWAKEGDMFYVYNCIELSNAVLPKFFKHNNWQSFVRQLNMYGFHKIYRYDREESTMNRKNPETQRWQFYHPEFHRDRPHLRNNIKRKSARSVNVAPAFSRVVFERDKGYYVQQDHPSRVFNGQDENTNPSTTHRILEHHINRKDSSNLMETLTSDSTLMLDLLLKHSTRLSKDTVISPMVSTLLTPLRRNFMLDLQDMPWVQDGL